MSKILAALIAGLFAVGAYAADPAKKDDKAAPAAAAKKEEAKPAAAAAKKEEAKPAAKKEEAKK